MLNNQKYLKLIASECTSKIENAVHNVEYFNSPFKHLVLDKLLTVEWAEQCLKYFADIDDGLWEHQNTRDIEVKYRTIWQS